MSETAEAVQRGDLAAQQSLQLSAELERLPGVLAAAVWLDEAGGVVQVRLHTQPQASASIVAHAATRVLEQRGQQVSAAALRVVPVAPLGEVLPTPGGGRFLVLHDISWSREGSRFTCRVQLAREAELLSGEATELDTESGRARAAALATLRAVERTTEGLALGLEGVAVVPLFGRRYLAVSVEAALQRRFAQLCSMVAFEATRSAEEAACMATLRAVERWVAI